MVNRFHFSLFFLLALTCFGACKPEKDQTPPILSIIELNSDSGYFAGDTLWMKLKVSDETNLVWVKANLINQGEINQSSVSKTNLGGKLVEINFALPIPFGLASGNYTLVLTAFDGENETNEYRTIYIQYKEAPDTHHGLYILGRNGDNSDLFFRSNQEIQLGSFPCDAGFLLTQPGTNSLYIAGSEVPKLFCTNLDGQLKWQVDFTSFPGQSSILSTCQDSGNVYIGLREGYIKAFSSDGLLTLQIPISSGLLPMQLIIHNGYLLAHLVGEAIPSILKVYNIQTGQVIYQANFPDLIKSFSVLDSERVLANSIQSSTGEGKISVISLNSNFNSISEFNVNPAPNKMVSMEDGQNFICSTSNGIYRFTYSPNSYVSLTGTGSCEDLVYNPNTHQLFIGNGNLLQIHNTFSSGTSTIISYHSFSKLSLIP